MTPKTKKKIEQIQNGETPNGYKFTDVGILPDNWGCARLSDISEQITQTAGTEKYETVSISAGIGFVNQVKKFGKELSGKQYAKYTVLHKGDFSYNKGNSKKYPQGCVYRLKDRETAAVPNVFESFRITTGCAEYYDQLFVSGYLNHQLYRLINHGVRDDGLLNLTHKDFYSCLLPVPPLPEQKRIAKILSAQDKIIECYEKKIEQLKRVKKYYLQNMFPKRGETVPKIRFKGFTESWEQRKLGDEAIEIVAGGDIDKSLLDGNGRYPVIGNALSNDGIIGYYTSAYRIKAPAVTVTGRGDVGHAKARTVDFTPVIRLLAFRSKHDVFFVENAINKINIIIESTGVPQLTVPQLSQNIIFFPPTIDEERVIGAFFDRINAFITHLQRKLEEEKKKKKALQQLLLTGIVRTN